MVFAVELNESAIGNEAREQPALFSRHDHVALGMDDQDGAPDLARGFAHIRVPADLKQSDGGIGGGPGAHLIGPGPQILQRPARLAPPRPYLQAGAVLPAPAEARAIEQDPSL